MTASDSHVDELIGPFALDAVDDTERRLVENHLKGCERCRAELRAFREAAVHLTDGMDLAPPSALRSSVLAAVAEEAHEAGETQGRDEDSALTDDEDSAQAGGPTGRPAAPKEGTARRGTKAWWGLAAAGLLAVGGWGIWQSVDEELSPTQEVIQADDAQRYETEYQGAPVTVVASSSLDSAVLVTDDLPALEQDEVYQGWWIDDEGSITSAGVLEGAAGAADVQRSLQGDPDAVSNFALSVEPRGGSEQPTTEPVVVLPLQS